MNKLPIEMIVIIALLAIAFIILAIEEIKRRQPKETGRTDINLDNLQKEDPGEISGTNTKTADTQRNKFNVLNRFTKKTTSVLEGITIKRLFRMALAVALIAILFIVWLVVTRLLGWKHGGGMIIQTAFLSLAVYLWITITKKTPDKKVVIKTIKAISGFFAVVILCFLASAFVVTPTINHMTQRYLKNEKQSPAYQESVDKILADFVNAANKDLPIMLDSVTRFDTAIYLPNKTILYGYTLLWCSKDNIDNSSDSIDLANILYRYSRNILMLPTHTTLRNNSVTFKYLYRDKDGKELATLRFEEKDFTKLADTISKPTINNRLITEARIMNKNLPKMVDSVTRLDSVMIISDRTILESYTVLYRKSELFSNKLDSAEFVAPIYNDIQNHLKSLVRKKGWSEYLDSGVVYEYLYRDKNGKKITNFRFEKKDLIAED